MIPEPLKTKAQYVALIKPILQGMDDWSLANIDLYRVWYNLDYVALFLDFISSESDDKIIEKHRQSIKNEWQNFKSATSEYVNSVFLERSRKRVTFATLLMKLRLSGFEYFYGGISTTEIAQKCLAYGVSMNGLITKDDESWSFGSYPVHSIDFRKIDLSSFDVSGSNFTNCNFSGVVFPAAYMVRATFQDCNFSGAVLTNVNAKDAKFYDCNMSDATLLGHCNFEYATFVRNKFNGAKAKKFFASGAIIVENVFEKASLQGFDARLSTMKDNNFKDAFMESATFIGATMEGNDFTKATLTNATFKDVENAEEDNVFAGAALMGATFD